MMYQGNDEITLFSYRTFNNVTLTQGNKHWFNKDGHELLYSLREASLKVVKKLNISLIDFNQYPRSHERRDLVHPVVQVSVILCDMIINQTKSWKYDGLRINL